MNPSKPRAVIGIFGLIGSGKSETAKIIGERYPVISADKISRKLMDADSRVISAVVSRHPQVIYSCKSSLPKIDRGKLGNIVFNDENERRWINSLMHPLIIEEIKRQIARICTGLCFVELTVYEPADIGFIDEIVLVQADYEKILRRVIKRSGWSKARIDAVYHIQKASESELLAAADYIISNDGNIWDLRREISEVLKKILSKFELFNNL